MPESKELKKIKRIYGEKFARMCREMFPTILEEEGALLDILERTFSHNCNSLYEAIVENGQRGEFEALIYQEFNSNLGKEVTERETRTPYEILDEKGYILVECKSEEDIQSFRKYYANNEVLCTIYNGGRLKTRDCFFAVKKNVEEIRREDFVNPNKSDEYSTSVLGIQFSRNKISEVQIISRYNHTVSNPNCTLNNDLDKLAIGLKQSFANLLKERGMTLNPKAMINFEIPGYTLANDGKYYKYNMEIDGNYYCPGNIVIFNGEANVVGEPEKGILMDYFYLDFQNKEIRLPDEHIKDSFQDTFGEIVKIDVEKSDSEKVIKVYSKGRKEPVVVKVNKDSEIIGYENDSVIEIENNFLCCNESLSELFMPNVEQIGDNFLRFNGSLSELFMPNVEQIGDNFLYYNRSLSELSMPNVEQIGDNFLCFNESLRELFMPNVEKVGSKFLYYNICLIELSMPDVKQVGSEFLYYNESLKELFMPNIKQVEDKFLYYNKSLSELSIPNVEQIGDKFLYHNRSLSELSMPNVEQIGDNFLCFNESLRELSMPNVKQVGEEFLYGNESLSELSMPNVKQVGSGFLYGNESLSELFMPNVKQIGDKFLYYNRSLSELSMPNVEQAGDHFLDGNTALMVVEMPKNSKLESKLNKIVKKNKKLERIKTKQRVIKEQDAEIAELSKDKNISREAQQH